MLRKKKTINLNMIDHHFPRNSTWNYIRGIPVEINNFLPRFIKLIMNRTILIDANDSIFLLFISFVLFAANPFKHIHSYWLAPIRNGDLAFVDTMPKHKQQW